MSATKIALSAACLVASVAAAGAQSFNGVSCDDVRALSKSEQSYWAKRLNLSAEQRHVVYTTCYQNRSSRPRGQEGANVVR